VRVEHLRPHLGEVGGKIVQVYLYGPKTSAYEVALVFEYPSSELSSLTSKIKLCLESFAEGLKAIEYPGVQSVQIVRLFCLKGIRT
jgi:hypothetical protein